MCRLGIDRFYLTHHQFISVKTKPDTGMKSLKEHPRRRAGSTVTELLVAGTLLLTTVAIVGRMTVQTQRIWIDIRHSQIAMDELDNQLDRLVALDLQALKSELPNLVASQPVRDVLANSQLAAKLIEDEDGQRIELSLNWDRALGARPITMVAWIEPPSSVADE